MLVNPYILFVSFLRWLTQKKTIFYAFFKNFIITPLVIDAIQQGHAGWTPKEGFGIAINFEGHNVQMLFLLTSFGLIRLTGMIVGLHRGPSGSRARVLDDGHRRLPEIQLCCFVWWSIIYYVFLSNFSAFHGSTRILSRFLYRWESPNRTHSCVSIV